MTDVSGIVQYMQRLTEVPPSGQESCAVSTLASVSSTATVTVHAFAGVQHGAAAAAAPEASLPTLADVYCPSDDSTFLAWHATKLAAACLSEWTASGDPREPIRVVELGCVRVVEWMCPSLAHHYGGNHYMHFVLFQYTFMYCVSLLCFYGSCSVGSGYVTIFVLLMLLRAPEYARCLEGRTCTWTCLDVSGAALDAASKSVSICAESIQGLNSAEVVVSFVRQDVCYIVEDVREARRAGNAHEVDHLVRNDSSDPAVSSHGADIVLFNPPYVPTDDAELDDARSVCGLTAVPLSIAAHADKDQTVAPGGVDDDALELGDVSLSLATHTLTWSGGSDGCRITNRAIDQLPGILSSRGVALLLVFGDEKSDGVERALARVGTASGGRLVGAVEAVHKSELETLSLVVVNHSKP